MNNTFNLIATNLVGRPGECEVVQNNVPSAGPAGRTRARAKAGSEWECHVEIEWIDTQLLTPQLGGWARGGGGRATEQQDSRGGVKRKCGVG